MIESVRAEGFKRLVIAVVMLLSCCIILPDVNAAQGQMMLNGRIKSIDLTSNTIVVTDYEGKDTTLNIEDPEIIAKFRDGLVKIGDDVNVKYMIKDGRNIPFSLRKVAGC